MKVDLENGRINNMEKIYIVLRDYIDSRRIVDEFTVEGEWNREVERAKKVARYIDTDKQQNKIVIYF